MLRLEGHRSEKGPIPSKKTSAKAPPPKDPDELDLNFEADDENASSMYEYYLLGIIIPHR